MTEQSDPVGPSLRPDSAPVHPNKIRAFREELRLDRDQFSTLIEANPNTERGWEIGASIPTGKAVINIIELAQKNWYPLTLEDILTTPESTKKKRRRRSNCESNKSR